MHLTLTLILSLLFLFCSASSVSPTHSPSPGPSQTLTSLHLPPPLPPCPPNLIGCLRHHHDRPHVTGGGAPPIVKKEKGRSNFAVKIGILFVAAAVLLQVALVWFLVHKRRQLDRFDFRSVVNSDS